ncbi:MAG: NUDIX hydrolase [Candidatus Latescibacterota bacterium]|jgi:ADP-ribose pyrophosphatase YjhB (NUDIX family)
MDPKFFDWARRLQAAAQSGLAFTKNPFEAERYEEVRRIAAEMMAATADMQIEKVEALFAAEKGYGTVKLGVRGVVFDAEDHILLVKERADGLWTLPGGFADVGLSGAENTVKEIEEESGYLTRAARLLAVYDREKHPHPQPYPFHVYNLFFLCELLGGEARTSAETEDVGFFSVDDLPPLSEGRVLPAQIERMRQLCKQDEFLADADFD